MDKHFFFDFDGVLVDSFEAHFNLFSAYYDVTEGDYRSLFMGNFFDCMEKASLKKRDIIAISADQEKALRERKNDLPIYQGMAASIHKPNTISAGSMYIVSSSQSVEITSWLQKNEIDSPFKEILGADIEKSKIKKFKYIFNKYDVDSANSYFITDTIGDILEARSLGIQTIAVTWGFHSKEQLADFQPDYIVSSPLELANLF